MEQNKRMIKLSSILGIAGFLIYLGLMILEQFYWKNVLAQSTGDILAAFGSPPHSQVTIGSHLLMAVAGILFIPAFLGLKKLLEIEKERFSITLGTIFGIIASAIMVIQMSVQGTVMVKMGKMYLAASEESQKQIISILYKGVRNFDIGIDLAFDCFFFTAWILFGYAMLKSKFFGRIFGSLGIILFSLTALINIWTAPNPPSIEIGPLVSLWVLAVFIQMYRAFRKLSPTS
jgi:hypothetical protein